MSLQRLALATFLFTVAMFGFNTVGSERTLAQAIPLSLFQGVAFAFFIYAWEWYRNRKR